MLLFAFDTGTRVLSAALADVESRTILASEEARPERGQHSLILPRVLLELCARAGQDPGALGAVAVGVGPGSFTGLRVGMATAKGIALARRIPLLGASSLSAMAAQAAPLAPVGALLVPTLDARRGQVYAGFYRGAERVAEDAVLDPSALAAQLAARAEPVHLFGEGALFYEPLLAAALGPAWARLSGAPRTPPAAGVAALCLPRVGPYDEEELFRLEPHYLRPAGAVQSQKPRDAEVRLPGAD